MNRVLVSVVLFNLWLMGQTTDLDQYKPYESYVELRGGQFIMGVNDREGVNHEYPPREAKVAPFRIMMYPVTMASFKKFKNSKFHHMTDAEEIGSSWVFEYLMTSVMQKHIDKKRLSDDSDDAMEARAYSMIPIKEARWNRPVGRYESIDHELTYPVTHVSYRDAEAYCSWKNMRLPTEIEWEYAARGGLKEKLYPWGDVWDTNKANLWQGEFPDENQLRDGYYGLSPVDAYKAQNDYELRDMLGNIWEWTTTKYRNLHSDDLHHYDKRVLKGGSFMDTRDGENRPDGMKIRISTRVGKHMTYSALNVGFRCVQSMTVNEANERIGSGRQHRVVKVRAPVNYAASSNQDTTDTTTKKQLYKRRVSSDL